MILLTQNTRKSFSNDFTHGAGGKGEAGFAKVRLPFCLGFRMPLGSNGRYPGCLGYGIILRKLYRDYTKTRPGSRLNNQYNGK